MVLANKMYVGAKALCTGFKLVTHVTGHVYISNCWVTMTLSTFQVYISIIMVYSFI